MEEYVLKPVNSVELTNVFTQLKIKLDQEINEKRNVEILEKYYVDSLPLLQANFYSSLIEGRIPEEEILGYLSDYRISFNGPYFCCLVIHTSSGQVPGDINPVLLSASVQRQAREHLVEKWQAKCFSYLGNTILIPQLGSENQVSELTDECDRFCKYARRIIGAVVTVGIGQVCGDILELPQSYENAREAVSYRVIYGTSRAINMKEIVPKKTAPFGQGKDSELSELFKMIRLGSDRDVEMAVDKYLKHLSFPEKTLQQHHIEVMELISALYRFSTNNDLAAEEFSRDMGKLYTRIIDLEPDVLKGWMMEMSLSFREQIIQDRNKSTKSFVARAIEYVENNYGDEDLSLDGICEYLGVSNSYFSTIFKKETGNAFITYLTDYRMDRAKNLLIETEEKSYIIAKQVGYTDPNYFSYVFKRRFGVSPSNYRRENIKQ